MKKLVLIPQERYEQLLLRESINQTGGANEQEVKEVEEKRQDKIEAKTPASTENLTPLDSEQEKKVTDTTPRVPPPGEPDLSKQTGGGAKQKTRKKKKNLWESRWISY